MPYIVQEAAPNVGLHCHGTSAQEWTYQPCPTLTISPLQRKLKISGIRSGCVKYGHTVEHNHHLQSVAQGGHCD
jgi:hypothetical protein